jgi:vacuolar-type H+-ATPase subunit H
MNQRQQAQLDALRDTQRFLHGEASGLAMTNQSSSRHALDDIIEEIETRGALQGQSTTDALNGTKRKNQLRVELRDHYLRLFAEIARTKVARSQLDSDFQVPEARVSDTALLTAATAIADAAEQSPERFAAELGPDFAVQLRTRIEELRDAVINRNHSQVTRKQTTQAVKDALLTARGIVRILDCMVLRETTDSPALQTGWQAAKHVKAKGGVPQGTHRGVPLAPAVSLVPLVSVTPTSPVPPAPELKAAA